MVLTFEFVDEILKCDHSYESYWAVLSFNTVYYAVQDCKMVLTFEFVDEILKCDHSNESYWAVLSFNTVYYAVQDCKMVLTFAFVDEILKCDIQMKATEQYFLVILFIMQCVVLTFKFVDEILKCDHSNESYWAVLSCETVYYAVQDCKMVLTFEFVWNP